MNRFPFISIILLIVVGALGACSEQSVPNSTVSTHRNISTEAEVKLQDSLTPRYDVTLAQGIDFRRPGYPNFLSGVSGMSVFEPWARWTDADVAPTAQFIFKDSLPRKFAMEITAMAFGPNNGAPIIVRVGPVEQRFVVTTKNEPSTQMLRFELKDGRANTIELIPPKPTSPHSLDQNNDDGRKLGVALISLKIVN